MAELSVLIEWSGEGSRFEGHGTHPETPSIQLDGVGKVGPSPMIALLLACASCSGADVVEILQKMRVGIVRVAVEVEGTRRDDVPKRYTAIRYRYTVSGEGLDRTKAERAVVLSLEKYCSVVHSLAADITIDYDIEIA